MILVICTVFFAILGGIGIVAPQRIARYFGTTAPSRDQVSELRAVYGGVCLGLALLGILALGNISLLSSIQTQYVYGLLLLSMAGGRLIGAIIRLPTYRSHVFLGIELVLGGVALYASLA